MEEKSSGRLLFGEEMCPCLFRHWEIFLDGLMLLILEKMIQEVTSLRICSWELA